MALFAIIGIVAILAYLYGQKRRASMRLREAINLTLAECQENASRADEAAQDGDPLRDRFDGARSSGAFDTAPVHLVATLHQAYDRPDRAAFERAAAQLAEYRDFRGWKG